MVFPKEEEVLLKNYFMKADSLMAYNFATAPNRNCPTSWELHKGRDWFMGYIDCPPELSLRLP
ncbi:hypothetical protein HPB48_014759 [Haemaphysalis longicornis]|uniref:Uncharacterized protein n=1 Tax=Haemaphysalis longicornis TaxID=44386 RepID=A0A9J6FVK1_HAELO|nr:hypothetical protein HPB48_014759 [Haemaphysalis longicornis]